MKSKLHDRLPQIFRSEHQLKLIDHFIGFLLNVLAKDVVLDSAENVTVIQISDLDWTVVRYPCLVNGDHTRKYQVGYVSKDSGTQLSRVDGADFVLKELVEK